MSSRGQQIQTETHDWNTDQTFPSPTNARYSSFNHAITAVAEGMVDPRVREVVDVDNSWDLREWEHRTTTSSGSLVSVRQL